MPEYIRRDKDLQAVDDTMSFTMSRTDYDLDCADIYVSDAVPGHLHTHKNYATDQFKAWIMVSPDQWEDLGPNFPCDLDQEPFVKHPKHVKLILTLGKGGEPCYILETSLKAQLQKDKTK